MALSKQIKIDGKIKRIGNYVHVKNFRAKKKQKLLNLFGGKCCICGYDKCPRNLHFHHVNPSEKSFILSSGVKDYGIEKSIEEAKKCILVCANCHGEIHSGLIDAKTFFKCQT